MTFLVISHHLVTFRDDLKISKILSFVNILTKDLRPKGDQKLFFFGALFHVLTPLFRPTSHIFRRLKIFPGGATRGFKAEFCAESI